MIHRETRCALCLLLSMLICPKRHSKILTGRYWLFSLNLFSGIRFSLHSHRIIAQNDWTREVCRINHSVCLVRSVQMCARQERKHKILFRVCPFRLVYLVHMLRQITFSLAQLLMSLPLPGAGMLWMSSFLAKWANVGHLNIGFIRHKELQSVCARPCGGLVFQTAFVIGAFRASSSLCG